MCVVEFLKRLLCYANVNIAVLSHFVLMTQAECFPVQVTPPLKYFREVVSNLAPTVSIISQLARVLTL